VARAGLLTPREREVFELIATGEPNKVIARHLGISFRTVELHRARLIEKLQARSLSDLIRMSMIMRNSEPIEKINPIRSRARHYGPSEPPAKPRYLLVGPMTFTFLIKVDAAVLVTRRMAA
jgi:DNA-binding CsgD family transcriptional regulator